MDKLIWSVAEVFLNAILDIWLPRIYIKIMCKSRQIYKRVCTQYCSCLFLLLNHVVLKKTLHVCLQTVRDSGAQFVKSLFRNKKELCSIGLQLPTKDATRLTEVCHTHSSATFKTKDILMLTISFALSDSLCVSAWSMWRGRCHPTGKLSYLQIWMFDNRPWECSICTCQIQSWYGSDGHWVILLRLGIECLSSC